MAVMVVEELVVPIARPRGGELVILGRLEGDLPLSAVKVKLGKVQKF